MMNSLAHADYVELGVSGNYRKIHLADTQTDQKAFDENYAYTVSASYYFREMTALEFSYSLGQNTRALPSNTLSSRTVHDYMMYGLDLVFTFGKRGDVFIPYVKGGVAYFSKKDISYEYTDHQSNNSFVENVRLEPTLVPSAGFGMQWRMSDHWYLKFGVEVWTSGPVSESMSDLDWAGRVGLSWFL